MSNKSFGEQLRDKIMEEFKEDESKGKELANTYEQTKLKT